MAFDIEGAKKSGYSDAEIADHLAQDSGFDIAAARKSGYSDAELLSHLSQNQAKYQDPNSDIPQVDENGVPLPGRPQPSGSGTQLSLIENPVVGGAEALVGGTIGGLAGLGGLAVGSVKGIGESVLDGTYGSKAGADKAAQVAAEYAGKASAPFMPRTETGQRYLENVASFVEPLAGATPLTAELAAIGQSSRLAAPAIRAASNSASKTVGEISSAARSALKKDDPGSELSMGAAEADAATRRREVAAQLPVDPQLTKGQATRDYNQIRFESEAMKGELGEPLRQRAAQQHQAIRQSFDDFIDQTGAQAPDVRAAGITIDKALLARSHRDKNEIRAAYAEANKSEEAKTPIDPNYSVTIGEGDGAINGSIIDYINSKPSGLRATGLIDDAKDYAIKLGIAVKAEDGSLIGRPATLRAMEDWRREIGNATGSEPTDIREATILKKIIDAQTEDSVGPVYKRARALRAKYANQYENRAVINDLLSNKRGTADRRVALEDVADRILFRGSLDDAKHVRKVLQNGGEDGQQAWRELQGIGLKYIRDEATKNVARGFDGQEMISPAALNKAVNRLDADGKLEALYGKNGAQKIRDLNDISRDLFTAPPGAVNHSNTAGFVTAALDMMASGSAGLPLPIATTIRYSVKNIKDRKLKAKIQSALGNVTKEK